MKYIIASAMSMVVCSVLAASVSAERLSFHGASSGWSEQIAFLYSIADDSFGGPPGHKSYNSPETLGNRSTSEKSEDSTFSDQGTQDSGGLSQFPDSVDGYSSGSSSGLGGRSSAESSADPQVKGLSRMDGISGFDSPGSIGK